MQSQPRAVSPDHSKWLEIDLQLSSESKSPDDLIEDDVVVILDEVCLRAEDVEGWMIEWRKNYLPGAFQRGL